MHFGWFLVLVMANVGLVLADSIDHHHNGVKEHRMRDRWLLPDLLQMAMSSMESKRQSDLKVDLRWLEAADSDSREQRAAKAHLANAIRLRYGMTRPRLGR